jgi:hypothetical protein
MNAFDDLLFFLLKMIGKLLQELMLLFCAPNLYANSVFFDIIAPENYLQNSKNIFISKVCFL